MKPKGYTYLLIIGVFAVWGIIIYKVISVFFSDETTGAPLRSTNLSYQKHQEKILDTFKVGVINRDPFLGTVLKSKSATGMNYNSKDNIRINSVTNKLPPVTYIGNLNNAKGKKRIAILNIRGKQIFLMEGQEYDTIRVIRIVKDSIKLKFLSKSFYAKLKKWMF